MSIAHLYPQPLWQWFEQICAIPHPSKHEAALSEHIQQWAQAKGLELVVDRVGNLIIRKPATAGMEDRQTVVIQAHLDMVPQKNNDTVHDFLTDPIQPWIDGEWVKAKGTTLGADNGIGMASALAILGSDDIKHGPLEVLLTVDEEAGMTGAFGLEAGLLKADILINTDSEQQGEIYMGCAGGVDATMTLPVTWVDAAADQQFFHFNIKGLKGGHSGVNIHLGRGNANKIFARFMFENGHLAAIAQFNGGTLRNAIPREANSLVAVSAANVAAFEAAVAQFQQTLTEELAIADPGIQLEILPAEAVSQVLAAETQRQVIALMHASPNGVLRMSDEVQGVTETSLNLGVVTLEQDKITLLSLIRSLIDSGREEVETMLKALAQLAGAQIEIAGAYPGWKPDNQSAVMAIVRETYHGIYGKDPHIMVIHAGLECGLFKKPYPEMDMVSIGPTIRFPHSPDEMVEIETVGQYWQLLLAVLERIPAKA